MDKKPIRVKFIGNYSAEAWLRQFPAGTKSWGECEFFFEIGVADYDWLVVYNDLPQGNREEIMDGRSQRSLLVTMEPHSIKTYGKSFTNQFDHVLTTQPSWALPHKNRIYSQCALQWYYGKGENRLLSHSFMQANPPVEKTKDLSTVCSTKQQRHTLHNRRYEFTQEVKSLLPEMDVYGHGVIEMDDKAEALDDYRYHLAIENYIGLHHWTEKLADVFLGVALPFYCGCPNAADYFPEESFIPLDINDAGAACEIISRAIRDKEYEKRLPYILEARRRVMEDYNMFAVLSQLLPALGTEPGLHNRAEHAILSRRMLRKRKPLVAVADFIEKTKVRIHQALMR